MLNNYFAKYAGIYWKLQFKKKANSAKNCESMAYGLYVQAKN